MRAKNLWIGLGGLALWTVLLGAFLAVDVARSLTGGPGAAVGLDGYELTLLGVLAAATILLAALLPSTARPLGPDPSTPVFETLEASVQAFLARDAGPAGRQQLLGRLVEASLRLGGASGALFEVVEGDTLVFHTGAGSVPPHPAKELLASHPMADCVRLNRPVRVEDTAAGIKDRSRVAQLPFRSALGLPVAYAGRVLAVLRLVAPTPGAFDEGAILRLRPLLPLIAHALWRGEATSDAAAARAERDDAVGRASQAESRFNLVADQLDDVLWMTDARREKMILVNGAYQTVFGRSPDPLYANARAWYEGVHPDDREAALKAVLEAKEDAFEATYRIVRPDKSVAWIRERGRLLRDSQRRPIAWSAVASDVTVAARLEAQERRLGFTLDRSPVISYAARPDGDYGITYISPNVERILGYAPGEIVRDSNFWTARIHADDQARAFAEYPSLFKRGTLVHEYRFKHADGSFRILRDEVGLLRTDDGQAFEIVGFLTDVTESKRNEEGVSYSLNRIKELQDSRTRILNTISHDLANPITPMRLQVYMLKDKVEAGGPAAKAVEIITRNLDQLTRLIEDLKDLARLEAGKLQVDLQHADLSELAKDAVETFQPAAEARGIKLVFEPAKSLAVEADPHRIGQVLYNFLSNANKFTPEKGHIRVETRRDGHLATVRVVDSGRGLTRDEMDRLFKPFSQVHDRKDTKEKGTGLGLYICKGLIESHGGKIFVESLGHGKGSTFGFSLPVSAKK